MNREEEITKQATIYSEDASNFIEYSDGWEEYDDIEYVQKAFIEGAKWADKTMIEKACEWLEQHQEDYDDYDAWKGTYANFNRLILDFKKSMEEWQGCSCHSTRELQTF